MGTARKNTGNGNQADAWMTVLDASRVLGESRLKVLSRGLKGDLVVQHIAGRACVLRESVERVLAEKQIA